MNIKNIKGFVNALLLVAIVGCCLSCETDLYETFDEYSEGSVVSVAKPLAIIPVQGNDNNVTFLVSVNSDPKLKQGFVTWNFGQGEKSFDIDRTVFNTGDIYQVEIVANEGPSQEFFIFLEDALGNESIKTSILVNVLGEEYRASLDNRTYSSVSLNNSDAVITWPTNNNPLLVSTSLTYTDVNDVVKTVVIDGSEVETVISDFQSEGTFSIKTTYVASINSIEYQDIVGPSYGAFITDATEGMFPALP